MGDIIITLQNMGMSTVAGEKEKKVVIVMQKRGKVNDLEMFLDGTLILDI